MKFSPYVSSGKPNMTTTKKRKTFFFQIIDLSTAESAVAIAKWCVRMKKKQTNKKCEQKHTNQ